MKRVNMSRCLRALGLESVDELLTIVETNGNHHIAGTRITRVGVSIPRIHMNGTANSKRFVHVYLWWVRLLGPYYPIGDLLLQGHVWKNMRPTCSLGINNSRGHLPHSKQVCIAPTHYNLSLSPDVGRAFVADVTELSRNSVYHENPACVEFLFTVVSMLKQGNTFLEVVAYVRANCPVFPGHVIPRASGQSVSLVEPPPLIYIG